MERLLKEKELYSTTFDKDYNELYQELSKKDIDLLEIQGTMGMLSGTFEVLNDINLKFLNMMLDDETYESEINKSKLDADEIMRKFHKIRIRVDSYVSKSLSDSQSNSYQNRRKLALPKIEILKFGGDIKEWLPFWSSFRRIHDDDEISTEDKFQFLIQAMKPKSRASQLIESYPATSENYEKALESLKSRFGRDDLLIEVYVRELLKLILNNLSNKGKLSILYDKLSTQLRALETLGVTTAKCAAILYPLVESCLPEEVLRVWQRSDIFSTDNPLQKRLDSLMVFLKKEVENEERIALATTGFDLKSKRFEIQNEQTISTAAGLLTQNKSKNKPICIFCKEEHYNSSCRQAAKMTFDERKKIASLKGCCHACLRFGHRIRNCRTAPKLTCESCRGHHVTLMCPEDHGRLSSEQTKNETLSNQSYNHVFLQTIAVHLTGRNKIRRVRALVNTGSHRSYILKKAALEMDYDVVGEEEIVHGLFGGSISQPVSHKVYRVSLKKMDNSYGCTFEALDQDTICGRVASIKNEKIVEEMRKIGIILTDIKEGEIEVMIGADIIGKLLTGQRHNLEMGVVAIETKLGWSVIGKVVSKQNSLSSLSISSFLNQNSKISDLWSLDILGISDPVTDKNKKETEEAVQKHFLETVKRKEDGRYEVSLPWIENHPSLPSNINLARKRLQSLIKRFERNGQYHEYDQVFKEWLDEGIIEIVPDIEENYESHYLSHHCVIKLSSATTKIRPVFDASARTSSSFPSLNQCLEKGTNLIELIPSILIGFRLRKFGVISDIRKAFLQISLNVNDRNFLKFLWYNEKNEMVTYRHARVVFGLTSSPFLLGAVIDYHLKIKLEDSNFSKESVQHLIHSFYVDNCITSFDSREDLQHFINDSTAIMAEAKFDLRLWEYTHDSKYILNDELTSVLGLKWNKKEDTLALSLENVDTNLFRCTKKSILSAANKIFDPIGIACPFLLVPKILLQKTCLLNLNWNEEVPEDISKQFFTWYSEITILKHFCIPRWLTQEVNPKKENVSFHLFCDASQHAYAAIVFMRVETSSLDHVQVQLVQAKSRVAPLKKMSICRLELLAATIGARLLNCVNNIFGNQYRDSTYHWTDSTSVLSWIKRGDNWKPFVRNRTNEIRSLTQSERWYYVPGEQNPADLPSRGCSIRHLIGSRWWEGPAWLKKPVSEWPTQKYTVNEEKVISEKQKEVIALFVKTDFTWLYTKFSKFQRITNLMGWIQRFIFNCRNPKNRRQGHLLLVEEIEMAEKQTIKLIQNEEFSSQNLKQFGTLSTFKDEMGILRVCTKISQRQDFENFRYPMLLSSKHPIVRRLIFDEHIKHCHAGVQTILNLLREKFWIIKGRKSIRSVISKCIRCRRFNIKNIDQPLVALPEDRVRDAAIFEVCGTDLAGPLFLKDKSKVWICIFTCAVYRAVHLKIVNSLSTDSFVQSLRRFISRRGRPSIMYSDNGTNFVGTENILSKINFGTIQRIKWKFNPPTAAWWGGWWERLIKILKDLLKRCLGKALISYEELSTLLCECEAVINSRPITYISDDSADMVSLTPAMFLQDIKEIGVPDLDNIEHLDLRKRIRYRLKLRENLRTRFRIEYLGQLALKRKTMLHNKNVKVGDIVLIGYDNKKRMEWPLAKVIEVYHGKDGNIRVVKLKTETNILIRPIQRIFPLEIVDKEEHKFMKLKRVEEIPENRTIEDSTMTIDDKEVIRTTRSGRKSKPPERLSY